MRWDRYIRDDIHVEAQLVNALILRAYQAGRAAEAYWSAKSAQETGIVPETEFQPVRDRFDSEVRSVLELIAEINGPQDTL